MMKHQNDSELLHPLTVGLSTRQNGDALPVAGDATPEPIRFRVTTTDNPRANAPRYTICTMSDIMNAVNSENVERFLSDFASMIRFSVATINMMQLIADEVAEDGFKASMNEFVWIDDN